MSSTPQKQTDEDTECPICCYSIEENDSPCKEFIAFPCGHSVCDVCFSKVEECPICRTGKNGESGLIRQERREREEREARFQLQPPRHTIVFFQGGDGSPEILAHPFSSESMTFRLSGLPPHLERIIPSVIHESMNFPRRRSRRLSTVGERQQVAAVLRASSSNLHIEDVLGRLFPNRRAS